MTEFASAERKSSATDDSIDALDDRDVRALTEYMTVLDDQGRVRGADGLFLVVSQSGSEYLVDQSLGACECWDDRRDDRPRCKHRRRIEFATGERSVPAWIDTDAVDDQLGHHVSGGPRQAATDGGTITPAANPDAPAVSPDASTTDDRQRVPVAGGVLVYEPRDLGRELVGVEAVEDWDDLADALTARGHDRGAIYHLDELDAPEADR